MLTLADVERLPATLTVAQYAEVVGVGRATAYRAVREGQVPVVRIGGSIKVLTVPLLRLLGVDVPGASDG